MGEYRIPFRVEHLKVGQWVDNIDLDVYVLGFEETWTKVGLATGRNGEEWLSGLQILNSDVGFELFNLYRL